MNRHGRRTTEATNKQRPKIVNYPDDRAPHEGAYICRYEVLWLRGAGAVLYIKHLLQFMVELTKPEPPQCFICDRDMVLRPGRRPWWVGRLSRTTFANSAADPRRFREALSNPPEPRSEGTVCMVGICERCCLADVDPNEMFKERLLADQAKRDSGTTFNSSAAARFSTKAGSA